MADGRTKFRKLRIAWSVVCGVLGLLLFALWVRSYRWADDLKISLSAPKRFIVHSMQGTTAWYVAAGGTPVGAWAIETDSVAALTEGVETDLSDNLTHIQLSRRPITLPHWVIILLCTLLAVAPWLRRQFSLRTLLIIMTLLAALLGLAIVFT